MLQDFINSILNLVRKDMSSLEVEVALNKLAQQAPERLNWRTSIVDLLKLLKLDSSVAARKKLADELGYTGNDTDGSAEKNVWLHKRVLAEVAKHGIKVPSSL